MSVLTCPSTLVVVLTNDDEEKSKEEGQDEKGELLNNRSSTTSPGMPSWMHKCTSWTHMRNHTMVFCLLCLVLGMFTCHCLVIWSMHIMWYVMGCVLLLVVNVDWEYLLGKHKQQGGCREDALDQGPNFVQWFL